MKHLLSSFSLQAKENAIEAYMKGPKSLVFDPVALSIGLPNKELIAKKELQDIINSLFNSGNDSFFNYCGSKGVAPLISAISKKENISEDYIMITTGNTQGFELCSRLFLNPKDSFAFEDYTYALAHSAAQQYNLNSVVVPIERDGIDVDYFEQALNEHPIKLLYLIPNAQNPTGITLSLEKRKRLIELAYLHDFAIIEDDPYRDLLFGNRLPSLFELDPLKEKVVYLYSYSKTIAPTFRTGFILAHPFYLHKLEQFKQTNDSCTSPLNQMIISEMIRSEKWNELLEKQKTFYETRKEITKKFLTKMNREYNWTSYEPEGGLFYWVDTNAGDVQELLQYAMKNGVIFVPGKAFALNDTTNTKFRLCYSYCDNKELIKGFDRLEESFIEWQHYSKISKNIQASL